MLKTVKPIRLLQVLGLAFILALSCALIGCGSGSSEPIVGKWDMISVQTDSQSGAVQRTGSATVGTDGKITVELEGKELASGTWKVIPKDQWPTNTDADLLGAYDLSMQIPNGAAGSWYGFVIKSTEAGKNTMGLYPSGTEIGFYFVKNA